MNDFTIAVDFDGTLIQDVGFGKLGSGDMVPNLELIKQLIEAKAVGAKIILWTCRENHDERCLLDQAVDLCAQHGLTFDAVNENIQPNDYEWEPRKVFADLYIDDRATIPEMFNETAVFNYADYMLDKYIEENRK